MEKDELAAGKDDLARGKVELARGKTLLSHGKTQVFRGKDHFFLDEIRSLRQICLWDRAVALLAKADDRESAAA